MVYVIIVTFNGSKWIEHCISSVYAASIKTFPIVVDNGSTDATLSIIREKFPDCQIIETGENLGFGKANNVGIQEAITQGAKYIYLLNQDAWVDDNCFSEIVLCLENNPEYGIISPLQMTGSGDKFDYNFFHDTLQRTQSLVTHRHDDTIFDKKLYEVPFVAAAHWMLRADDIKRIGHFSTIFPHYDEDNNLIQRYQYWGKKIGVCTCAKGYHDREYRQDSQSKQLYKKYCYILNGLNNPLISTVDRVLLFFRFVARCLKINGVSFSHKAATIIKGASKWRISAKYRKLYKTDKCYSEFQVLLK